MLHHTNKPVKLYDLIKMDDRSEVIYETKKIIAMMYENFDYTTYEEVYNDIIKLFKGEYPGFQSCNTEYHDLNHTLNTLLATARLMHGYSLKKGVLSKDMVLIGLVAALFHDTGYIQKIGDKKGTGARYTINHVDRSIKFAREYLLKKGFKKKDIYDCSNIIKCTNINSKIDSIRFKSHDSMVIGKILGTADCIGQMADRIYLEKLLFLFREFVEGNIKDFKNEFDLLKKTTLFYMLIQDRCENELGGMSHYMVYHFKARWGIDEDLYQKAIDNNIQYLNKIANDLSENYLSYLKRANIVERLLNHKQKT